MNHFATYISAHIKSITEERYNPLAAVMKVQFKTQSHSTDIPFPDKDLEPFSAVTAQLPGLASWHSH